MVIFQGWPEKAKAVLLKKTHRVHKEKTLSIKLYDPVRMLFELITNKTLAYYLLTGYENILMRMPSLSF
jgi:hypothetical protein